MVQPVIKTPDMLRKKILGDYGMTFQKALIYKLIHDAELFEKKTSLITATIRDDKSIDTDVLNRGISMKAQWTSGVIVYVSGTQPVDYLLCGPRHHAVSQAAKEVIESLVGADIEFLPVNMVNKNSKEPSGQYWILNVIQNIDALDWEYTRWISDDIPYNKPGAYLSIIKPAFKLKKIENRHIFLLRVGRHIKSGIYISAVLRKKLEARKAVLGMDFMPIKVL